MSKDLLKVGGLILLGAGVAIGYLRYTSLRAAPHEEQVTTTEEPEVIEVPQKVRVH